MRLLLTGYTKQNTQDRYDVAVRKFLGWCADFGHGERFSVEDLDALVFRYISWVYVGGNTRGNRQNCVNLVSGVSMYLPHARGRLVLCSRALHSWDKLVPGKVGVPVPYGVMLLLCFLFRAAGDREMALLVQLCFRLYLRISEALGLRVSDVKVPSKGGGSSSVGGVYMAHAKTGRDQSAVFVDPVLVSFLEEHLVGLGTSDRLFPFSYSDVRQRLKSALALLGLSHLPLVTPHSFRHGGATHAYILGTRMEDIMVQGRWASLQTARRYVQAGRSLLFSLRLTSEIEQMVSVLEMDPSLLLEV